jgi:hypothetical protein
VPTAPLLSLNFLRATVTLSGSWNLSGFPWDILGYLFFKRYLSPWDIPDLSHFCNFQIENLNLRYLLLIFVTVAFKRNTKGLGQLKLYQGCPLMPILYHSLLQLAFLAAALCFLLVRVAWPRLAPSCSTATCLSSVSAADKPPMLGLQRPNCHSHEFSLYKLLPPSPPA